MERVLVVDDEESIRTFIAEVLELEGLRVTAAPDGAAAVRLLQQSTFHLLITDLRMPNLDGMALLRKVRAEQPEMEVIVLTAHGTVETAVEAMKLGAYDYLRKPLSGPDELALTAKRALERRRLREDQQRSSARTDETPELVARDPAMLAVVEQMRKVAPTDATVLLLGESGTGKEVVARAIHRESRRRDGPFVAVNCAALSPSLLESEMFGHEKGAFTGASALRRGRFELADGGTLFLDELAELEPQLQAKLLRVLEERRFERVGGSRQIEVDVRLLAATNRDLGERMPRGSVSRRPVPPAGRVPDPPGAAPGTSTRPGAPRAAPPRPYRGPGRATDALAGRRGKGTPGDVPLARERPRARERAGARRNPG